MRELSTHVDNPVNNCLSLKLRITCVHQIQGVDRKIGIAFIFRKDNGNQIIS
jgi:hypothetical protein